MPRLFEITFITKDTRLAKALLALEGIAMGKPEITPITGAKYSGGKVRATKDANYGGFTATMKEALNKWPKPTIQRHEISKLMEHAGASLGGLGSLIKRFKKRGLLKVLGAGKPGFKIVKGKTNG